MRPGNLAGQRQAQSRALNAAAQRIMRAEKLLENLFLAGCRHAEATVEHAQLGAVAIRRQFNFDLLALAGILLAVGEQVDEHLGQRVAVAANRDGDGGKHRLEREARGLQVRAVGFNGLARERRQIARNKIVFLLASLDAREVEDIVDEPGESGGLGRDDPQEMAPLGVVLHAVFGEHLGEHADGRERRFEFVRDVADEVGLLPRERQLPAQIGADEPASDADGQHEKADEKAEREPRGRGGLAGLGGVQQINGRFPVGQHFADLGGDEGVFPAGAFGRERLGMVLVGARHREGLDAVSIRPE